jgi:hypothetical protein
MDLLFIIGVSVYMMGHGARGLPSAGITGSIAMIVGGVLVLASGLT